MNLKEIEKRMAEINERLSANNLTNEEMDALETELNTLIEEKRKALEEIETRKANLRAAINSPSSVQPVVLPQTEERTYDRDSVEYRHAWLNTLRGVELSDVEKRAWSSTEAAPTIPTQTANDIIKKIREFAPLTAEITMLYVPGRVTYAVEKTVAAASDHAENAAITAAQDALEKIELTPTEIVKLVQISESVRTMAVDAFETWLIETLAESVARKITIKIIGLLSGLTATATSVTAANVQALLGSIRGRNIKLLCNNKTLFTSLAPLQDNSKNNLVRFEGKDAYIYGRPVMIDEDIADGTLYAGDFKKIIGDLPQTVQVKNQFDIDHNAYKFLGVAMFDAKIALTEAFGVIKPAAGSQ